MPGRTTKGRRFRPRQPQPEPAVTGAAVLLSPLATTDGDWVTQRPDAPPPRPPTPRPPAGPVAPAPRRTRRPSPTATAALAGV